MRRRPSCKAVSLRNTAGSAAPPLFSLLCSALRGVQSFQVGDRNVVNRKVIFAISRFRLAKQRDSLRQLICWCFPSKLTRPQESACRQE